MNNVWLCQYWSSFVTRDELDLTPPQDTLTQWHHSSATLTLFIWLELDSRIFSVLFQTVHNALPVFVFCV